MEARVTLRPGARGTKKLLEEHGDRLVCVRYRYDVTTGRRYKTAEIIIEESDWTPRPRARPLNAEQEPRRQPQIVAVKVHWGEKDLAGEVGRHGGVWDPAMKLWLLPISAARDLGLDARIVRVVAMPGREAERPVPGARSDSA